MEKIKLLLSSIRFWQVVIAGIVYALGQEGIIGTVLANTIIGILGTSVTVGTVDRFGEKVGG